MKEKTDITSAALENGIKVAKTFIDKLIIPTVEETGLLIKDRVTLWRFKNQISMLLKAKQYCEKRKISTKTISLKFLCPLLDYAGLEENETLQDKWANLLTNMVDSQQNIENHVFPYLLNQISVDEFMLLDSVIKMKIDRINKQKKELSVFLENKQLKEKELKEKIVEIESTIAQEKATNKNLNQSLWEFQRKKWDITLI